MYGDLDKLSYIVNINHPIIKLVMDNINRVLQHFSIFENEGINFNIKKQYVEAVVDNVQPAVLHGAVVTVAKGAAFDVILQSSVAEKQ